MDKIIRDVLCKIEENGFKAYVVGGFVRDLLLNIDSYDVDICTDALPKNIKEIFDVTTDSNNYGSINFKIGDYNFDITTFRKEIEYFDRKPEKLEFIKDVYIDVLRRDFTINTICLDKDSKFIDYLDGKSAINNRIIKLIGEKDRLKEDPLRILRAIRFATILDFELDTELKDGIYLYKELVDTLSGLRIKNELDKILVSKNYQKGLKLIEDFGLLNYIGIKFDNIVNVEDLCGIYAQMDFSEKLPFTKNELKNIEDIRTVLNKNKIDNFSLYEYGLYVNQVAGKILNIDKEYVNDLYNKLPIVQKKDLDISAIEIKDSLHLENFDNINEIQNKIIDEILKNNLNNNKDDIIKYLERM